MTGTWIPFCARCDRYLRDSDPIGESAIYNPGPNNGIDLCVPCFFLEETEIEQRGTNVLPDTLAEYLETLRRHA